MQNNTYYSVRSRWTKQQHKSVANKFITVQTWHSSWGRTRDSSVRVSLCTIEADLNVNRKWKLTLFSGFTVSPHSIIFVRKLSPNIFYPHWGITKTKMGIFKIKIEITFNSKFQYLIETCKNCFPAKALYSGWLPYWGVFFKTYMEIFI